MAPLPLQNPDVTKNRQGGICHFLNLQEDNVRFILLAVFLYIYLAIGACIFSAIEESGENKTRRDFQALYDEFIRNFTSCYYSHPSTHIPPEVFKDKKFSFGGPDVNVANLVSSQNKIDDVEMVGDNKGKNEPFRVTLDGLHELLFAYGNATQAGMVWKRKRWDWVGSFHFAWTIVSTIGYGATTPSTTLGKLLIIPYGFIGCAGGLLFFNLFLERIITFLATCMRSYRLQRQKRRPCIDNDLATDTNKADPRNAAGSAAAAAVTITVAAARRGASPSRSSAGEESIVEQPDWKPSVYWVMLCLFIMSVTVIVASGTLFQQMEGWTFGEAIYFSFVSYATIGLGDYVSLQQPSYGALEMLYRIVAFALMVFGCSCIYSLLNVTSIVIKQFLNYIIKRMDYCGECCCCTYCRCSAAKVRRRMSSKRRRPPRHLRRNIKNGLGNNSDRCQISVLDKSHSARAFALGHHQYDMPDYDGNDEDEGGFGGLGGSRFDLDERRCSGENMISLRGELSNKVSLAVLQKRLYETAQMSRHSTYDYPGSFSATSVGPLAIVMEKLGDNPV